MDFSELKQLQALRKGREQIEEARERYQSPPKFVTGDHVHETRHVHHFSEYKPGAGVKQYGVVISHGPASAKVKFDNGTESTFTHRGIERNPKSRYGAREIDHNYVPGENSLQRRRASNEEHRAHIEAEKKLINDQHEKYHSKLMGDLASIHHSKFRPEHHRILSDMITDLKDK